MLKVIKYAERKDEKRKNRRKMKKKEGKEKGRSKLPKTSYPGYGC
jgi:hypothetical protein